MDHEQNKAQIAQFSLKDAEKYGEYESMLNAIVSAVDPLLGKCYLREEQKRSDQLESWLLTTFCKEIFLIFRKLMYRRRNPESVQGVQAKNTHYMLRKLVLFAYTRKKLPLYSFSFRVLACLTRN